MTDANYRVIVGAILVVALYFHLQAVVAAMIVMMLLEGITNWRVPRLVNRLRGADNASFQDDPVLAPLAMDARYDFSAERMWRLVVATVLTISLLLADLGYFWLFPWFMGFAIFGAGVSRVCPMLIAIKWAGFR